MSDQPSRNRDGLDIEMARRIDEVCRRFEADWRQGHQPHTEGYLLDVSHEGQPALRAELEALERELRKSEDTVARPEAGPPAAPEPQTALHPSTITEAPTIAPGPPPTSLMTGAPPSSVHEEATVPPSDSAPTAHDQPTTAVLGQDPSATPDTFEPTRVRYFGDYEIVREIARGGMGVVFRARQVTLNRTVALKMILAGQLANDTEVKRFYTEAEAAANLDHPGIVPIFEVGQHEGQHYFSMGFVEGQSLSQRLAEGPLPSREAAELIRRVSEAIEYAHQHGVIHRDLKPANILLDQNGNPRVTDFGLAKRVQGDSGLTGSGQIMGTPSYMPPEQARGKRGEVGPTADVYALGATLYALVTGRPPFLAATPMDTVIQAISDEPVPPRRLNAALSRDLETICLKCLEKDPGKRYASAAALAEDLRRYLANEPILARPVGPAERAWRWSRRSPVVAGLAAGIALALVLGTVVAWYFALRATEGERLAQKNAGEARENLGLASKQADRANQEAGKAIQEAHRADQARKAESEQRRRAEEYLYPSHIALANHELSVGNVDRVTELLNQCPERLRRWEWHYLKRQLGANRLTFRGHLAPVRALALMPDGHRAATADESGIVLIWELSEGNILARCTGHEGAVLALAVRPDGQVLASAGRDAIVRLWEPATGRLLHELKGHRAPIPTLAFSADGQRLASGGWDGLVKVWDAATGRDLRTLSGSRGWVTCVSFAHQGHYLVASSWKRPLGLPGDPPETADTHVWETDSGRTLLDRERRASGLPSAYFEAVGEPLRDHEAGRDVGNLVERNARLRIVAVSRDQRRAEALGVTDFPGGPIIPLTGLPGEISLTTSSGPAPIRLAGHTECVSALVFDRSGHGLVSSSLDGTVRVWDAAPELGLSDRSLTGLPSEVAAVATSRDGRLVAGWAGGQLRVWATESGERLLTAPSPGDGYGTRLFFLPDGRHIIAPVAAGAFARWNVASGQVVTRYQGETGHVASVALSPDGRILASTPGAARLGPGGEAKPQDYIVTLYDTRTAQIRHRLRASQWSIHNLAFSPDGLQLVTAGGRSDRRGIEQASPGELKIWDTASGRLAHDLGGHPGYVLSLAFRPDGRRLASAGKDGLIRIWNPEDGQLVCTLRGHTGRVDKLLYSPDGSLLVSRDHVQVVRVWDADPGRQRLALHGQMHPFAASTLHDLIAVSPDGQRLVTIVADRADPVHSAQLTLYDLTNGQRLLALSEQKGTVRDLVFSPDGSRIIMACSDGTVRIREASPQTPELQLLREARGVLALLFALNLPVPEIVARIRRDVTISGEVRERALGLVEPYAQARAADEADRLVPSLFAKLVLKNDVMESLRADTTLSEPVRRSALSLAEARPDDPIAEGAALADRGRWEHAAAAYARAFADKAVDNPGLWFEQAILRLVVDDATGYRSACQHMLDVLRRRDDQVWLELTAHAWALAPGGPAERAQALELAERRAKVLHFPWSETVLGMALYRTGRFAEADARLRSSLKHDPAWDRCGLDWLVLAMANQRLGRPDEARHWLKRAENWVADRLRGRPGGPVRAVPESWHWRDAMLLHLLLREARALILERLPDLPDNPFAAP